MSIYDDKTILFFFLILASVFGAIMGSFLNCAAWRLGRGESFITGRSQCPHCGHVLGAAELVPVLSWVFLKGRCRWCKEKVSARYPLTELGFSLLTVVCLLRFDLTPLCFRNYLFLCCLFVLTLTDLDAMVIPDGCLILAALVWLLFCPFLDLTGRDILLHVAAAVVFGGSLLGISLLMDHMLQRDTLGGGDIKLFAVVGLYLGFVATLFALMFACVAGLFYYGLGKKHGGKEFPFGPWIALGTAVMLLYGEPLVNWYMSFLR
ncbi:MAG: prepilin peptidase [Blautia sp.]|nr:prepilin peptidase [Blautia sp.]